MKHEQVRHITIRESKLTTTSNGLRVMTGGSSEEGFTRAAHHFLPLTPLRELAPSHPKRESPAMTQATDAWLRVEEVIT